MKRLFLLCLSIWAGVFIAAAAENRTLSLQQVREQVLAKHPRITVAELRALAARQTANEVRAGFYPVISANATAADNDGAPNTRIAAGALNNPSVYERAAVGAGFTQLITDFGRTSALASAAKLRARAAGTNVASVRAQLLLETDIAYFSALAARAVKQVVAQTLDNRKLLLDRVSALASNRLKSELDVRFAQVGLDEARLLASKAEKDWLAALAGLAALLGEREPGGFDTMEMSAPADVPEEVGPLVLLALQQRPDLVRQRFEREAAQDFARAEAKLHLPTISAFGTAGVVPLHDSHFDHEYAAAGLNLNLPLFAGGLHEARRRGAALLSDAAEAALRDTENGVVRDVRLAWLEARQARDQIKLTASLLESAQEALSLARARFEQGLISIIEIGQAELNVTAAEISLANSRYDYHIRRDLLDYQTGGLR